MAEAKNVVTDYEMPEMGGMDFTRAVRGLRPGLKVLGMTGLSEQARRKSEYKDQPVDGLIEKPFGAGAFMRAVQDCLASK